MVPYQLNRSSIVCGGDSEAVVRERMWLELVLLIMGIKQALQWCEMGNFMIFTTYHLLET